MSEHKHRCPWCAIEPKDECMLCGGSGRVTHAFDENDQVDKQITNLNWKLFNEYALKAAVEAVNMERKKYEK